MKMNQNLVFKSNLKCVLFLRCDFNPVNFKRVRVCVSTKRNPLCLTQNLFIVEPTSVASTKVVRRLIEVADFSPVFVNFMRDTFTRYVKLFLA